jgi:hypothetical protein
VKTTKPSEDLNNPHGYSDMDWAAQLDPAYAAKPVPNYASSAGESHPPPARLPPHTTPAGHRRTAMKVPDIRRPETGRPAGHVSGGHTSARDTRLLRAGAFSGSVPLGILRAPLCGGAAV